MKRRHCRQTKVEHEAHRWQHAEVSSLSGAFTVRSRPFTDVSYWCNGKAMKETK